MTNTIQNLELYKYPSTQHLQGSQLQKGDAGHGAMSKGGKRANPRAPYSVLAGRFIVVEEKLDGANCGVSFGPGGELLLQSRGHYLAGGGRERQFGILKRWAAVHENALLERLGDRYVMYGEWMGKKHSVFYNHLPHLFCEFDIYDRSTGVFLSTAARSALLDDAPVVSSEGRMYPVSTEWGRPFQPGEFVEPRVVQLCLLAVPVLFAGVAPPRIEDLLDLVGPSLARTPDWRADFEAVVQREGLDLAKCWAQADKSDMAEGLYIKVEEDGVVKARYKWVRSDFVQAILDANMHHSQQPFVPNQLAPQVDIYAPRISTTWANLHGEKENQHEQQ